MVLLGRQLKGGSLYEYLMAEGLLGQNKGKTRTFITRVRREFLDLKICGIGIQKPIIHG